MYVPVYYRQPNDHDYDNMVVGRVKANTRLDTWDGKNYTFRGSTGIHGGITKLKKPRGDKSFVFIRTSQWVGDKPIGWLISDDEALSLLIEAGREDLINKWFPDADIDMEEEI